MGRSKGILLPVRIPQEANHLPPDIIEGEGRGQAGNGGGGGGNGGGGTRGGGVPVPHRLQHLPRLSSAAEDWLRASL